MDALRVIFRVSERFFCRVLRHHLSIHRHAIKDVHIEEDKLRSRIREIAAEHIRWVYGWRIARFGVGWLVNHKRVQRLLREERLQRPIPRKQQRARPAVGTLRHHQD